MNQTRRIESIIFDQENLFPNLKLEGTGLKIALISNSPYCYFGGNDYENGIHSFHLGNIVVPKSFVFAGHFDQNATDAASPERFEPRAENILMPILLDLKKSGTVQSNFDLSSSPAHDAFHATDPDDRLKATEGCGGLPSSRTSGSDTRDLSFQFPYYTALKSENGGRPTTFCYVPVVLPNLTIAYFEKSTMGDEMQTVASAQTEMNIKNNELSFPLIVGNDILLDENLGGALLVKKLDLPVVVQM